METAQVLGNEAVLVVPIRGMLAQFIQMNQMWIYGLDVLQGCLL